MLIHTTIEYARRVSQPYGLAPPRPLRPPQRAGGAR